MRLVGGGDHDRVERGVARDGHRVVGPGAAELGDEPLDVRRVRIGDGGDLDPGERGEGAGVERAHPADADDPDAERIL